MKVSIENQWPDFGLGFTFIKGDGVMFNKSMIATLVGPIAIEITRK